MPSDRDTPFAASKPDDPPAMLPRSIIRQTTLVRDGRAQGTIVYPAQDPVYRSLAELIAAAIERRTGSRPITLPDTQVIPRRDCPIPDSFRHQASVVLGSINSNRVLLPLYARSCCATDATYPGGDGHDLRTIVNPFGTGANAILVGGSTSIGVRHAVDRLVAHIEEDGRPAELTLPHLLDVAVDEALARRLIAWPETALDRPRPRSDNDLLGAIGSYAIMYAWTGDERYGRYSADCLCELNARHDRTYGDWHYRIDRIVRALPWLTAGGFLEDADVLRTDELLLGTAIETQDMWWRQANGQPPLGHRHHGKGTFAFYLQARFLRDQARPNAAARRLCDRWIGECATFLDALAEAHADDQDDESTLNNLATLVWYALGEERFSFFESGNARLCSERAIAIHDNQGAGAGTGGYGEGQPGAMYLHQDAGLMVSATALYFQDRELKWVIEHFPHLKDFLRMDGWTLLPGYMHKFDTGTELIPSPPERLRGMRVIPASPYHVRITTDPPEHVQPRGHSVNAPETWLSPPGVGRNELPVERAFDKLVFRGGFAPDDPYLLLQGWQGGWRWQGSMDAANAIVRFGQAGHIFLIQNTDRQPYYHKNGLTIGDGWNTQPLPPMAELLAVDDFPATALSATRVVPYHHASWTRYLFCSKAGQGFFVVLDAAVVADDGPHAFVCTWRTPGFATLDGRSWRARQGNHQFTLVASQPLVSTSDDEGLQGAACPYVLRQHQNGALRGGSLVTFQNLFFVRPTSDPEPLDLRYLSPTQAIVTGVDGIPAAWVAIDPLGDGISGPGITAEAICAMLTDDELVVAGARDVRLTNGPDLHVTSDRPVGLRIDLAHGVVDVQADGPESAGARVHLSLGEQTATVTIDGRTPRQIGLSDLAQLPRAKPEAHPFGAILRAFASTGASPASQPPATVVPEATGAIPAGEPQFNWRFDGWSPIYERLRDVTVVANPPPVDGFADQLIDGVLPESRATVRQWPDADHYDVSLSFGHETYVDHLRLVGDSQAQPTLQAFHPLPERIDVSISSDDFATDIRSIQASPVPDGVGFTRFYGFEDRFTALRFPIQSTAAQMRLRVPSPNRDAPLVLHEIELYGRRQVTPPLRQLIADDLDRDGRWEVVAVNCADEMIVLAEDGAVRWRWQAPSQITHVSCHDLSGDGRRQVCVGTLDGQLIIFEPNGAPRTTVSVAQFQRQAEHLYFGLLYSVNGLAVWHRAADGRGALAVGAYSLIAFLDPDGQLLGHSWADGSWQDNLLPIPSDDGASFDLWVRNRWNHGIGIYTGQPEVTPSDAAVEFGGLRQPMFRALRRVIPFVSGPAIAFDRVDQPNGKPSMILAATAHGLGTLSVDREDWIWKIEGGVPLHACLISDTDRDGEDEVVCGQADGFVCSYGLLDGHPRRRRVVGTTITGLAAWPGHPIWIVATPNRLLALDSDWRIVREWTMPVDRLVALDPGRVVVADRSGRLAQIRYEG